MTITGSSSPRSKRWRRLAILATVALVLAGVGFASYRAWSRSEEQKRAIALAANAGAELERRRRSEAIRALDRAMRAEPQSSEARMLRALIDFQSGDYAAALALFQRCRPSNLNERDLVL